MERLLDLEAADPLVILSLLLASCVSYIHTFDDLSLSEKWKQYLTSKVVMGVSLSLVERAQPGT